MGARAETIEVSCEDYQRVMNVRASCAAKPMWPVNTERWRGKLHQACMKEHQLTPMSNSDACADTAPAPRAEMAQVSDAAACKLPPWKRRKGLVCAE